jgi:GNAT superfamily N-acetyltransferase
MSEPPRSEFRLTRAASIPMTLPDGLRLRSVTGGDDAALAQLMERAYAGTIDEHLGGNSDGAVEVAGWRSETALEEVSVAVVDADDTVLAASMCSGIPGRDVWISYVVTAPAWKGRGLATAAVAESVRRIRERTDAEVRAGVTDGNLPSERLLARVGFERVGPV